MGVVQRGGRSRLLLEAMAAVRVVRTPRREHLDGDDAVETRITGLVHLAHATGADRGEDLVRSETRARRKGHGTLNGTVSASDSPENGADRQQSSTLHGGHGSEEVDSLSRPRPAILSRDVTNRLAGRAVPVLLLQQRRVRTPHVHVQDGSSLAKFWLDPVELAGSTGFASQELTRLRSLVTEHREELLEAWHEFFGS
jgi:hypothetical protein